MSGMPRRHRSPDGTIPTRNPVISRCVVELVSAVARPWFRRSDLDQRPGITVAPRPRSQRITSLAFCACHGGHRTAGTRTFAGGRRAVAGAAALIAAGGASRMPTNRLSRTQPPPEATGRESTAPTSLSAATVPLSSRYRSWRSGSLPFRRTFAAMPTSSLSAMPPVPSFTVARRCTDRRLRRRARGS